MICQICKSKVNRIYKVVKNVEIFECKNCLIAFTKNIPSLEGSNQNGRLFYHFKGYKKEERKLRKRFKRLVEIIKRYKKSGKALDVGGGFGLFTSILLSKGKFTVGIIEPENLLQYINILKHKVYRTSFEQFRGRRKTYDIIIMMDVLEHFSNPIANLKKAKSLLKSDGILVVQTPNYKSLMARICRDWAWWMVEDHKFFFSPKSLKLMLKKVGFEVDYFITYEDFVDFKKNLDGNFIKLKNKIIRKLIKSIFYLFFLPVYFLSRNTLWKHGSGGLIFTIAKRSEMV